MSLRRIIVNLKIRAKLLAAFGSILLLSVLLIVFSITSINKIIAFKATNEKVDALKLHLERMDVSLKDFIYEEFKTAEFQERKTCPSMATFKNSFDTSVYILNNITNEKTINDEKAKQLSRNLVKKLNEIDTSFLRLIGLLQRRGFRDYGLEGSLRTAIHTVENSSYPYDKADMLTLRRHEKDFFLRKDLRYVTEFNQQHEKFKSKLQQTSNETELPEIIVNVDNYKALFNQVVEIESQIGLKEKDGLKGEVRAEFDLIKPGLQHFSTIVRTQNEQQILRTKIILTIIFAVQIITGLVLTILYANILTTSIKQIRSAMQKLANGTFPNKFLVYSSEEIGQTKLAFNQFIDRLKSASDFAEKLGSGDLSIQYDEQFNNDVLAKSIISMQKKLKDSEDKQSKINWANEGAAKFNDILKSDTHDLNGLSDNILHFLIHYLNANQGALYILTKQDNEEYLERFATYAYNKKKFVNEKISIHTGLLGQAIAEKSVIFLKDIPKAYVKITSGLGEATPRNVLIAPMKQGDVVMGVLEIASFNNLELHQIEFLERIGENIATLLSNNRRAAETQQLLQESRERANALAQQEEEMRQNSEELRATQEQMERQRNEMLQEIESLKGLLTITRNVPV